MKIKETHEFYNSDHGDATNVTVVVETDNGEENSVSIGEGEKEDMYLFRDSSDAYSIVELIRMAYNAGKRGEEMNYEFIEERDE
jgi:hypothetical protein